MLKIVYVLTVIFIGPNGTWDETEEFYGMEDCIKAAAVYANFLNTVEISCSTDIK